MSAKFRLGKLFITPGALALSEEKNIDLLALVVRHVSGDYGNVDTEDKRANDRAIAEGTRILSAYQLGDDRIWILTEADRSASTILLPSEY